MDVLVISDSHGIKEELVELLAYYRDKVDYIVHCGDSEYDSSDTAWGLVDVVVRGNMDFDIEYPRDAVLKTKKCNMFVTHGHFYGVNASRYDAAALAKEQGCAIALYGHTHVLRVEEINGVVCINPGSLHHSRGRVPERTFAMLHFDESMLTVKYFKADRTHLAELDKVVTL